MIRKDQSPRFGTHVIHGLTDKFNHHRVKCIICTCFGTRTQPLPHTLSARVQRESERSDSDTVFQITPQRTDTYTKLLKYPFWQVFW